MDADIIYVLDHGHVAEKGTHSELIRNNGLYARLWESQNHFHGHVPVSTFYSFKFSFSQRNQNQMMIWKCLSWISTNAAEALTVTVNKPLRIAQLPTGSS